MALFIQLVRGDHSLNVLQRIYDLRLLVDADRGQGLFEELDHVFLIVEDLLVLWRDMSKLLHKVTKQVEESYELNSAHQMLLLLSIVKRELICAHKQLLVLDPDSEDQSFESISRAERVSDRIHQVAHQRGLAKAHLQVVRIEQVRKVMEYVKNLLEVGILQDLLDGQHSQILDLRDLHQVRTCFLLFATYMTLHQVYEVLRSLKACNSKPEKDVARKENLLRGERQILRQNVNVVRENSAGSFPLVLGLSQVFL